MSCKTGSSQSCLAEFSPFSDGVRMGTQTHAVCMCRSSDVSLHEQTVHFLCCSGLQL